MALHEFGIRDLVQPDDELSLYLANLALASNEPTSRGSAGLHVVHKRCLDQLFIERLHDAP